MSEYNGLYATAEDTEITAEAANETEGINIPIESENATQHGAGGKTSVYTLELKEEFIFCDVTYKKLEFNFEKLTGQDMIDAENEMAENNEYAIAPEFSTKFMFILAAKAAGVSSDVILKLPVSAASKIRNKTRSFLLNRE